MITSHTEGSPQVVKEALACGCPIVSVDVGDVKERTRNANGCWIAENSSAADISVLINEAIHFSGRTNGREALVVDGLTNEDIAQKLIDIYGGLK